jgi:hypothetical protein
MDLSRRVHILEAGNMTLILIARFGVNAKKAMGIIMLTGKFSGVQNMFNDDLKEE